jgi:hypothetical protein
MNYSSAAGDLPGHQRSVLVELESIMRTVPRYNLDIKLFIRFSSTEPGGCGRGRLRSRASFWRLNIQRGGLVVAHRPWRAVPVFSDCHVAPSRPSVATTSHKSPPAPLRTPLRSSVGLAAAVPSEDDLVIASHAPGSSARSEAREDFATPEANVSTRSAHGIFSCHVVLVLLPMSRSRYGH